MSEISIAIADDNLQTLSLLNDILEGEEDFHVVGRADNGEDAYNMIVKTSPDVVLLDDVGVKTIKNFAPISIVP